MRAFTALRRYAFTYDELAAKVLAHDKDLAEINEVLRWLGEENKARHDEIQAIQDESDTPDGSWENRLRIGFKT